MAFHFRYAGDIIYFVSSRGLKRPLKIAFDKFVKQQFNGLSAVQLHAMPLDPSKAREALAFSIFRAAGVPAPRTAFAEVTLTVPGKYDNEYLGLFTVVEDTDGPFVAEHFPPGTGLLMRPFRVRGIDFLGDDWERYQAQYRPQRPATADEARRVIAQLRRALGAALARRRRICRVERQDELHVLSGVALSRLGHRLIQRRQAVRSIRPGANRR